MLCWQGKENVLGSSDCYTGFGSLRAQLHIDILCESGEAGVGTLHGLPHLQEFRGHFRMYVESWPCSKNAFLANTGPIIGDELCHSVVHSIKTSDPTSSATSCH